MTQSPVRTRTEGPILEVTLDRPKANAIDLATSRRWARPSAPSATTRRSGSRS
jgi:enoyl-CoA hydratase/carnithine racemase